MDLIGKVVAITGASRGLGAGLARAAFARGAALALCSRGAPELPDGERVLSMRVDVSDAARVDAFAEAAFERFGRVDLWVNNAGLLEPIGPLRELDATALHALFDVNVLGAALGSRAYARELHRRDARGVLLNISSGAARKAYFGWSAYCASKAAVDRLSEALALEEAPRLTVYSVAPGVIDTAMQTTIRTQSAERFPDVDRFRELHESGGLRSPEQAGEQLLRLAFDPRAARPHVCVDLRS
jgi:benzil reductase ((S)-benzoin forming)